MAFLAGTTLGALLLVPPVLLAGGLLSPIPVRVRFGAAVAMLAFVAAVRAGWVRKGWKLPQNGRLIPPEVVAARGPKGAFNFALTLGSGLFTYLPSAGLHLLAVGLVLLSPGVLTTLAAIAAFGAGRGVVFAARSLVVRRDLFDDTADRLIRLGERLVVSLFVGVTMVASTVLGGI